MDANRLRGWLGLPPGPWPPADRELLGLPADGPADPAAVEAAALDRMARLRTHQILHPDLVTEGMNRVAQAMVAVGSGAAARRKPVPVRPLPPPPPDLPPGPTLVLAPADVPRVLDAVPVPAADAPPVALVAVPPAFRRPPAQPIPIPAEANPPPGLALDAGQVPPHARRAAYRELAGLRHVLRALDGFRPSVALPGEGLLTPAAVCDLLEAISGFRTAAAHKGLRRGFARRLTPRLSAVCDHPLPLAVFRSLTRPQRVELAREWAAGRAGLLARLEAVRGGLWRPRRVGANGLTRGLAAAAAAYPELALVAATAALGLVAVVRSAGR